MFKHGFEKGTILPRLHPTRFSATYNGIMQNFQYYKVEKKLSVSNFNLSRALICKMATFSKVSEKDLSKMRIKPLLIPYRFYAVKSINSLGKCLHGLQKRDFFGEKLGRLRMSVLEDSDKKEDWGDAEAAKFLLFITSNFYETIKKYDSILVFFLAKWCGHCKKLKRPYADAALMLHKASLPGTFAVFDIMSDPDVADQENIVGVPILKYFRKGRLITFYSGKRTAEDLFNFMKNPPHDPIYEKKIEI